MPEPSPWTVREKLARALWMLAGQVLFRMTFHNWYGLRSFLLRIFGAKIGDGVKIRPTVRVEIPWNLAVGDGATVGDYAILYCLGRITLGERCVISQYAHLCAGTHDFESSDFKLIRKPIEIGAEAWIATDVFVGPGVNVGARCVVGARSNVFGDLPPDMICVGSPAKAVRRRIIAAST